MRHRGSRSIFSSPWTLAMRSPNSAHWNTIISIGVKMVLSRDARVRTKRRNRRAVWAQLACARRGYGFVAGGVGRAVAGADE